MEELVSVVTPTVKHLAEGTFDFNEIITSVFRARSEIKGPVCQISWHLTVRNNFNINPRFLTRNLSVSRVESPNPEQINVIFFM